MNGDNKYKLTSEHIRAIENGLNEKCTVEIKPLDGIKIIKTLRKDITPRSMK